MTSYVVTNHLICHLTHSSTEVTTCPNMLTPVTFFKMRELLLQHARRTTLDLLHYLTRRQMPRGCNQDVNMIFAHVPLFYQQIVLLTYLSDHLPNSKFHFSCKNMVTVFCHPHKVLLDVVYRVRTFAIFHESPSQMPS